MWESKDQLKLYRAKVAEAVRRDHRTLGAKLDLFSIQEQAGECVNATFTAAGATGATGAVFVFIV